MTDRATMERIAEIRKRYSDPLIQACKCGQAVCGFCSVKLLLAAYDSISGKAGDGELVAEWRDGFPPKPWSQEWFIAVTTYGDRVVLRALPDEYTYDFKTADETYIRKDKIAKWMQFPDSEFVAQPALTRAEASASGGGAYRLVPVGYLSHLYGVLAATTRGEFGEDFNLAKTLTKTYLQDAAPTSTAGGA